MPKIPSAPKSEPKETPKETVVESAPAPKSVSDIPSEERLLAALAYFPFLFVGALIMKPDSKFCQMHAKQGMALSGIAFLILFILAAIPTIGSLFFLALIAAIAIGGFQAYSGVEWKMPVLYPFAMKINVDKLFAGTTVKPTSTKPEETKEPEAKIPETPSDQTATVTSATPVAPPATATPVAPPATATPVAPPATATPVAPAAQTPPPPAEQPK